MKNRYFCISIMVFSFIFLLGGCESSSYGQIITGNSPSEAVKEEDGSSLTETEEKEESREDETFWKKVGKTGVYIYGAVNNPGVYYLDSNARVVDLVKAAGGFKKNASRTSVNLAAYLKDAGTVRILTKKQAKNQKRENIADEIEISDETESTEQSGLVNINRAEKEELMSLKGVGETKAEAIIAYRQEHGGFKAIEEIMEISGIKEGTFNKIKSKITI